MVEASDLFFGIELAKKYPLVAAVVEIIRNLPGVKEHIATRGPDELPAKSFEEEMHVINVKNKKF